MITRVAAVIINALGLTARHNRGNINSNFQKGTARRTALDWSNPVEQDMAEDTIRVGIIGAGANTRSKHIPGLMAQDEVEVYGVVNRTRASSEKAAGDFGIANVYDDWQDLLDDDEIDAVCIGTCPTCTTRAPWLPSKWVNTSSSKPEWQ